MPTVDVILALAELGLVVGSLTWLATTIRRGGRARWPVALCIVTAVTVAQPFGIIATPDNPPPHATVQSPQALHVLRGPAGTRVPFVLYERDDLLRGDSEPQGAVRARTWAWGPLLTNSSRIA